VSGTIVPDSTGDYDTLGFHNGKGYCKHKSSSFYIWWDGTDSWIISAALGVTGADYHKRTDPDIVGVYGPQGSATGDATVAEGYT
jgi:hypothetical protein